MGVEGLGSGQKEDLAGAIQRVWFGVERYRAELLGQGTGLWEGQT